MLGKKRENVVLRKGQINNFKERKFEISRKGESSNLSKESSLICVGKANKIRKILCGNFFSKEQDN